MSSKSKSNLSETPSSKVSPATPRVSKLSRGVAKSDTDSPSPLQNSRPSVDRSPRSIGAKPTLDRRSPKLSTPPEKQPTRVLKGSELQAQLSIAQEDLKKSNEKLVFLEKENARVTDELKEAQRLAEEANEKLREATVAQKRAEEDSEIEKFRAVEMEQAGIEAAQKKEEEWQKELEAVRNQHALDVAALLSASQELQRIKQELVMTHGAKNQALDHADNATKIAEIHAEKVDILSAELVRLKALLDSRLEMEANESNKLVFELKGEIVTLEQELQKARTCEEKLLEKEASLEQELQKARTCEEKLLEKEALLEQELQKAGTYEEKLLEKEASMEQLNVELEAAKMAESYACNLVDEWKKRVDKLEVQAKEASRLERSASESLESVMKQLEASNDSVLDAQSEVASLKEKVALLDISIGRQRGDLEESEHRLRMAKEETSEMAEKVESLKAKVESLNEEKIQALNNEKLAAASVQSLLEEKNKLINELESSRDEEEKSKKAMESLASALHEVSSEARETKEKLLSSYAAHENCETQIEDFKLVLKATNEKYESMLDDAKHEIDTLTSLIEQSKQDYEKFKADWEQKVLHLTDCVKKSDEENSSLENEISRLVNLLKEAEVNASATKEDEAQLKSILKEAESEVIYLKEVLGDAKAETMKLKENFMDKENELRSVVQENEELRTREAASLKKVEELSKLLEEVMAKDQAEENGELTESEKDYDMLPKVVEFSEQNGDGAKEKPKLEVPSSQPAKANPQEENNGLDDETTQTSTKPVKSLNGKPEDNVNKEKEDDDSVEVEFKMWESCKIGDKDFSPEREPEQESFEEELESKAEGGEGCDPINGLSSTENLENGETSPLKEQHQKKKKPLLRKFGSLLKKKTTNNQKQ